MEMEEELEVSDGALNGFVIEQEEESPIKDKKDPNTARKSKKPKKADIKSKKTRKNKNKSTKSITGKEKVTIMKKKKSFVKAKADNSVVIVNCDSDNEGEYVCYPEFSVSQEELKDENEDFSSSEPNYHDLVDEFYVGNYLQNPVEEDEKLVENYLSRECCQRKCNTKFKTDELLRYRLELQCLDYNENGVNQLDLVLLGLIHSLCRISNEIRHSRIVEVKERRRIKMMFAFRGVSVCRAMFMFAHCIKIERLKRLIKHYKENGVSPRAHGNYKRIPSNAISVEQMRDVVSFLKQYADENAAVVSGRSGHQNHDIKILPPHETKLRVFNKYKEACEEQNTKCISVVSFRRLWNRFCPNVLIQRSNSQMTTKGLSSVEVEDIFEATEIIST